jgi:hypothetical protein
VSVLVRERRRGGGERPSAVQRRRLRWGREKHTAAAHSSTQHATHISCSNHTRNAPLALRTAVPPASTGVQHRQSSRHTPVSPPALTFASSRSAWHCHRHATQHWYELPSTLTDRVRLLTRRQPSRCQRGRLGGRREEEQGRRRKREYE